MLPALLLLPLLAGDVRLPAIFASHMVLQRDAEVPLWGFAGPGAGVHVRADWMTEDATAAADAQGRWSVTLRTPGAGGPHRITVTGGNQIQLDDVLLGEVWLGSGQSNMEMRVHELGKDHPGAVDWEAELRGELPPIRLFDVRNAVGSVPQPDCTGAWSACTPQRVRDFSAVAWFFGRTLWRELHVPIGLVTADWGGTPAEAWTSGRTLRTLPAYAAAVTQLESQTSEQFATRRAAALTRWWQRLAEVDPGSKAGWQAPAWDDAAWQVMAQPHTWDGALADFDGVVWLRRVVEIPAAWAGQDLALSLGAVDDMDDTWWNGTRVGGMNDVDLWDTPRHYVVPGAQVQAGRNVLVVRVLDTGGNGGLIGQPGQLTLHRKGDPTQPVSLAGDWRWHLGCKRADLPRFPGAAGPGANTPTALFNGMIAPLLPLRIRGAIWYQGESNRERAFEYRTLFPSLIADWRSQFGHGEFPFYFVQIAPYGYERDQGEAAELREAQLRTLAVPHTGMAVTMDLGDPRDIHPRRKEEVGRRLALWALAQDYGRKEVVYSGPQYRAMELRGTAIRLSFTHTAGGLVASDQLPLRGFTIAGEDHTFVPAVAVIEGDQLVVSAGSVPKPAAVRFAWGAADEPNLANKAGLPASSFRTDDWPMRTQR